MPPPASETPEIVLQRDQASIRVDASRWEMKIEDVTILEKIGAGAYGSVYKAEWNNTLVAVKTLTPPSTEDEEVQTFIREFSNEVSVLCQLRHPNIVGFVAASLKPPTYSIATEYAEHGSLHDVLHKPVTRERFNINLSMSRKFKIVHGISSGMAYLHSTAGMIHRDLKPGNVLLDGSNTPKIADFGLSKTLERSRSAGIVGQQLDVSTNTQLVGTPLWMAPEVILGENYDNKCDVYSFGIIMWEVLTEQMPFDEFQCRSTNELVLRVGRDPSFRPSLPPLQEDNNISFVQAQEKFRELIVQCWAHAPSDRPSFDVICKQLKNALRGAEDSASTLSFEQGPESSSSSSMLASSKSQTME